MANYAYNMSFVNEYARPMSYCDDASMSEPQRSCKPKLLDQIRDRLHTLHYSLRTEDAYVEWVRRFVLFHDKHRFEGQVLTYSRPGCCVMWEPIRWQHQ